MDNNYLILEYKNSLNELERKALEIAEKNLESSFCIEKINRIFIIFKNTQLMMTFSHK